MRRLLRGRNPHRTRRISGPPRGGSFRNGSLRPESKLNPCQCGQSWSDPVHNGTVIDTNQPFPDFGLQLVDGRTSRVPAELEPGWQVLLFYRGHW
jgi:hypothetical protein